MSHTTVEIDNRSVMVSNPDKVMNPDEDITKQDVTNSSRSPRGRPLHMSFTASLI